MKQADKKNPDNKPDCTSGSGTDFSGTQKSDALKKDIYRSWYSNREAAFLLYDKLLSLRKKEQESGAHVQPDKKRITCLAEQLTDPGYRDEALVDNALSRDVAAYLKECVDKFRWQDNEKSVKYAEALIRLGVMRGDKSQEALGLMALGDSIAITGKNLEKAWLLQKKGAEIFLREGDLTGWARTTIGRVAICIEMQCIKPTLEEASMALGIFKRYDRRDLFVRLSLNIMRMLGENGQYQETLVYFKKAHPVALSLKAEGEEHLGLLYINTGTSYLNLGEFNQAYEYFNKAREILTRLNKLEALNHILSSIANIENIRGNYREALNLWNKILLSLEGTNSIYVIRYKMRMAECYLNLNRDSEAREMSLALIRDIDLLGEKNGIHLAHGLRCLGMAEAKLGLLEDAQQHLLQAADCYAAVTSSTWIRICELLRGKIYLRQGNYHQPLKIAGEAAAFFRKNQQPVNAARAYQLQAECFIKLGKYRNAINCGQLLLRMGKAKQIAQFCYHGHMLLGNAAADANHSAKAGHHYIKAVETIEELQKNLTLTLRPEFLEDKCEAGYALIRLLLTQRQAAAAFEALERLKSLTMLSSLTNRSRLFWSDDTPESGSLITELSRLRGEYAALSGINREKGLLPDNAPVIDPALLSGKLKIYEKKMRQCIERLYLINAGRDQFIPVKQLTLKEIQQHIPESTCLLQYFLDEEALDVFIVTKKTIDVCRLPAAIAEIGSLLEKYYQNINYALQEGARSPLAGNLIRLLKNIGQKFYNALVQPVRDYRQPGVKLIIIPFGILHYVPFNTLYNGRQYFIEETEITLLPSAGFLTRPCIPRAPGMVVLAHTGNGKLPHIKAEALAINSLFPGALYLDKAAVRPCLQRTPVQILHIAAHGRHRMDLPDLSALRLEDGELYADDLLQQDMGYELVTLSGCETGRTVVKKSEELLGLIRGVLLAGAQALTVSLWRVDDALTTQLMTDFYTCLHAGKSKAASLREAQLRLINIQPELHPAYWGAFQLVGFPGPLSCRKE